MMLFKVAGVLIGLYTAYSAFSGRVYVKSGISGRTLTRSESPEYFWLVIVIYAGLSLALMVIF